MSIQNPIELLMDEIHKRERELRELKELMLKEKKEAYDAFQRGGRLYQYTHKLEEIIDDFCEGLQW